MVRAHTALPPPALMVWVLYACALACRRVADDSRAVDFDPQAVLEDVRKLLGVKGDGDSGEVDSGSDEFGDGDSDANSLDGLGTVSLMGHYHSSAVLPHFLPHILSSVAQHLICL